MTARASGDWMSRRKSLGLEECANADQGYNKGHQ